MPAGHSQLQAVMLQYPATVPHIGGVAVVGGAQTVIDPGLVPSVHYQSQASSLQNEATVPHIGGVVVVGPVQTGAGPSHLHMV